MKKLRYSIFVGLLPQTGSTPLPRRIVVDLTKVGNSVVRI